MRHPKTGDSGKGTGRNNFQRKKKLRQEELQANFERVREGAESRPEQVERVDDVRQEAPGSRPDVSSIATRRLEKLRSEHKHSRENLAAIVSLLTNKTEKQNLFDQIPGSLGEGVDERKLSKERDAMENIAQRVFESIAREVISEEGEEFNTEKNIEQIVGYLKLSLPIHNINISDGKGQALYATQRVALLKNFMKTVKTRLAADRNQLSGEFQLDLSSVKYNLTGSDTHRGGEAVVIIEDAQGKKVVYKPRSLGADKSLMGDDGIFSMQQFEDLGLPKAKFLELSDGKSTYGYMQYFSPHRRLSKSEAENWYQIMGELKIISKYLGINDLHQDNIMVTKDGVPVIIDAETTYLPDVFTSQDVNETVLDSALTKFNHNDQQTSNAFTVSGEEIPEEPYGYTALAQARLTDSKYKERHQLGQLMALAKILNMPQKERSEMVDRIREAGSVRLVPLGTDRFQIMREAFWQKQTLSEKDELVKQQVDVIIENLKQDGYQIVEGGEELIKLQLEQDHLAGDIPYFSFDTKSFNVSYGKNEVAKYTHQKNYQSLLRVSKEGLLNYFFDQAESLESQDSEAA